MKVKKRLEPGEPTAQQVIDVFRNSLAYEIMYTFGVPATFDETDYFSWEQVNFARMGHARVLYAFLMTPATQRNASNDDVVSEDFGFPAQKISLPDDDKDRLNKDVMHLTYSRLRHTPESKPWSDSILACLVNPVLAFMEHVKDRSQLFADGLASHDLWLAIIGLLRSDRELRIKVAFSRDGQVTYELRPGRPLPGGVQSLTRLVVPGQPT
jgi:hypothetical protein